MNGNKPLGETLQASVSMLSTQVNNITVRRTLKNYWLICLAPKRKPLISKNNITAWFAILHLNKPEHVWTLDLWTEEIKLQMSPLIFSV